MSMEPLPHGFGEFSMAMTDDASLASLWPLPPTLQDLHCYQSVQEVKQRLAAVTAELRVAREEVRYKEQNIASLVEQVRRTAQERDLLRQQQHLLLTREMEASATPTACTLTSSPPVPVNRAATFGVQSSAAVDHRSTAAALEVPSFAARELPPVTSSQASATAVACPLMSSSSSQVAVANRSRAMAVEVPSFAAHELPPLTSSRTSATPAACPLTSSSSYQVAVDPAAMIKPFVVPSSAAVLVDRRSMAKEVEVPSFVRLVCEDRSTAMALEMLAARRPLPQQGRLVQTVMEAGPLLQNLLVAGPLPQWRNPPPSQALADAMILVPSGSGAPMGLSWPIH